MLIAIEALDIYSIENIYTYNTLIYNKKNKISRKIFHKSNIIQNIYVLYSIIYKEYIQMLSTYLITKNNNKSISNMLIKYINKYIYIYNKYNSYYENNSFIQHKAILNST